MKSWYSVVDLVGLPGLPGTKKGVIDVATRQAWKHQPRPGRGGGKEYALKSLPKITQDHLLQVAIAQVPALAAPVVAPLSGDVTQLVPVSAPDHLPDARSLVAANPTAVSADPAADRHLATNPTPSTRLRTGPNAPRDVTELKDWQRRRMEARLALLQEIDRLGTVLGLEKSIKTLVNQADLGQLPPELAAMLGVANAKSGGADGERTLSRRTLYRWLADRAQGYLALAPKSTERQRVPAWAPALLQLYQRPTKPSLAWALGELPQHLPEGTAAPSYWAASRFLKKLGSVERERGRLGTRDLRNLQPFRRRSTREMWPGDVYTTDGHTFDAEIRHPVHGRPFRPEITSCLDVCTRRSVGWSIALAESGWAVLDALRHACLVGGIPAIFYVDNGSGYCNALMDDAAVGLLARLSITKATSIPYNARLSGPAGAALMNLRGPMSTGIRLSAAGGLHWCKPCPFCRSDYLQIAVGSRWARVECKGISCHCQGPEIAIWDEMNKNVEYCVERWNDAKR
ncbi:DNA-binding protein [Thiocystis violascens]|uniref:Integrase family protein n=1 Tax=Thiocystis violascens (strain ATCC 17096 / DSM 198 / 6111) TaxID=765911 RepID=I3YEF5_THIV6|nr:DNA-binding protein [Thiocystis violascens]AFL75373.1 integrase family protein [Thiocystis violascens DSM 198]